MMDNPRWVVATLALLYLLTPSTVDASMHLQQQGQFIFLCSHAWSGVGWWVEYLIIESYSTNPR